MTVSALAPHSDATPAGHPTLRTTLRVVGAPHSVALVAPATTREPRKVPTTTATTTSAVHTRRTALANIVDELAELAIDRSMAARMPASRGWLTEIRAQRSALRARARELCAQLGQHQPPACPECRPPTPAPGGSR